MSAPTYGKARYGANGAAPRSTGPPPAMYPGSVATNDRLTIAVDRLQTKLAAPLGLADVLMTVQDGTGIVPSCLLSIDAEIVQVQSGSGNVWQISRSFDGTAPAVHLSGAVVSGFVDAWHHNALVSEVEAIETFLGPNGGNLSGFALQTPIPFVAQTPGGSLIAGNNSILLSPVPRGVNGTDQHHYLWISGGTGTAEAALITGGDAVSGSPSGHVIVNCAYAHSGAWTISSASSGIQEAISTGSRAIFVPAGSYPIYGTVTIPDYVSLTGAGPGAVLLPQSNGMTVVKIALGAGFTGASVSNLCLDGTALGLGAGNTIKGILVASGCSKVLLERLWISNIRYGIYQDASTANQVDLTVRDVWAHEFTGGYFGNQITGEPNNLVYNTLIDGWHLHCDTIAPPIALEFSGSVSTMLHHFVSNDHLGNVGIQLTGHNEGFAFTDSVIGHPGVGIYLKTAPSGAAPQWSQIGPNVLIDQAVTQAIKLESGSDFTQVMGCAITNLAAGSVGINIPDAASYITYGIRIQNCTFQGIPATATAIQAQNFSQQFSITGNFISGDPGATGITLGTNATSWIIEDNIVEVGTPLVNNSPATGVPNVLRNNLGINPAPGWGAPITAAATITPVYQAFEVFGSSLINTITVPAGVNAGYTITIAPQGAFTWGGAGNIAFAGSAMVGRILTFTWSGTKWWPSYTITPGLLIRQEPKGDAL